MALEWEPGLFCHSGVDSRKAVGELIPNGMKPKLFLTDPPYNLGFDYGSVDDSMEIDEYHKMLLEVFDVAYKAADDNSHLFIINYPEIIGRMWDDVIEPKRKDGLPRKKAYWQFKQWVTWCYPNNWPPNRTKFTRASRAIIWMTKGKPKANVKQIVQPYRNPWDRRVKQLMNEGKIGPALYDWWPNIDLCKNVSSDKVTDPKYANQMPEMLLKRIIHITTEPGDLVADPFAGTFSTVKAALHTSRLGWGSDLNESTKIYHPSKEEYQDWYLVNHDRIKDMQWFDIDAKNEPFDFERAGISVENLIKTLYAGSNQLPEKQRILLNLELERLEYYSKNSNINLLSSRTNTEEIKIEDYEWLKNLIELIPKNSLKDLLLSHDIQFNLNSHEKTKRKLLFEFLKRIIPDRDEVDGVKNDSYPREGFERNFN